MRPLTKRKEGRSLNDIIAKVNRFLRGWYGYFRESPSSGLDRQDGWVRRCFRALLRKRLNRPGQGKNQDDHQQWPNCWFAAQGLFSLTSVSFAYG